MKDLVFREALNNYVEENNVEEDCGDVLMLDNHAYDRSIVGITVDGKLVYDYEKMVEEFMDDEECDELEALEWLEYNTMRALPYMGERRPIILIENRDSLLDKYGGNMSGATVRRSLSAARLSVGFCDCHSPNLDAAA